MLKTSDGLAWTKRQVDHYTATNRSILSIPRPFMPKDNRSMCGHFSCFLGGEDRASENIALVSVQTLFLREHNRIADILSKINPLWNDETLYQEARRIVVAEIQHITYNEFLSIISPNNTLKPLKTGFYTGYDPSLNSTLFNEFAAAAFRFGHSLG